MVDQYNIIGISTLIISISTFIIIKKKFSLISFISIAWLGLFVYSTPVFLNFTRKIYYSLYDPTYLVIPSDQSKIVYLLFWLGFLLNLVITKKKNKIILRNLEKDSLNVFYLICKINLVLYFFYYIFLSNQNSFLLLIARWLFTFVLIIYAIQGNKLKIFLLYLILVTYSIYVPDRTLLVVSFFTTIIVYVYHNYLKINFRSIVFFSALLVFFIFIIIFNKMFHNIYIHKFKLPDFGFLDTLNNLNRSFEPLIVFAHSEIIINVKNFDTLKYLKSISSNLLIFPSYFGFENNYYYKTLIENIPIYVSYGLGGSIFASTYIAFGYAGVFLFSYLYSFTIVKIDFYVKNSKSLNSIFGTIVLGLLTTYIFRNSLDNFLSFIRQILVLYVILRLQLFLILKLKKLIYENSSFNK